MPDAVLVRCFRFIIHGQFEVRVRLASRLPVRGFYTTRWVVANDEEAAVRKAFQSAQRELQQLSDVRDGLIATNMDAEDVDAGSWWEWLRGGGRGFSFYENE